MKKLRTYILVTLVISLFAGYGLQALMPTKRIDERAFLSEVAPDAVFSEKRGNPPHYQSGQGIVAFNTYDVTPSFRGYAGPIKLLLALTKDGKIAGIRLLEHEETKNYVHAMETPEYLRQFLGKSVNDPFVVDRDIDGISRATVSVQALARTVKESSRTVASNVLGIKVREDEAKKGGGAGGLIYLTLFSTSFILYFATRRSRELLRIRDISLVLGFFIAGLYLSTPFSILHIYNLLLLRPSSSLLWYAIVISTIISIAVAGRFYCGWLCPFGALSEFIGRLPFKKWHLPVELDDRWRRLKYWILGFVIVIVFVSRKAEFGNYETYITLFSYHGHFLAWSLVIVSLLASLRIERFWCRYLCPVAALTGIFSRKDSGYVSRYDCPMGNKPMPEISECIRCNRCYQGDRQQTEEWYD